MAGLGFFDSGGFGMDPAQRRNMMLLALASGLANQGGATSPGMMAQGFGQGSSNAMFGYMNMLAQQRREQQAEAERQRRISAYQQAGAMMAPWLKTHPEFAWAQPLLAAGDPSAMSPIMSAYMRSLEQKQGGGVKPFQVGTETAYFHVDENGNPIGERIPGMGGPMWSPDRGGGGDHLTSGDILAGIEQKILMSVRLTPGELALARSHNLSVPPNLYPEATATTAMGDLGTDVTTAPGSEGPGWIERIWNRLYNGEAEAAPPVTDPNQELSGPTPPASPAQPQVPTPPSGALPPQPAPLPPPPVTRGSVLGNPLLGPMSALTATKPAPVTPTRPEPITDREFGAIALNVYRTGLRPSPTIMNRLNATQRRAINDAIRTSPVNAR